MKKPCDIAKTDFLYWSERDAIRKEVFARDPPLCVWCSVELGDYRHDNYYQVDHITPRCEGGPYMPENLALSCKSCNQERGNLSVFGFMVSRAK